MKQNSITVNEDLFAKHLAQECNDAESQALNNWLELKPENKADFDKYATLWKLSENNAPKFDLDEAWEEIHAKTDHLDQRTGIYDQEGRILTLDTEEPVKKNYYSWIGMVVILILLGIGLWFQSTLAPESNKPSYIEISQVDQQQDLELKDGSKVTIAQDADLKYFETVKGDSREVWLSGKAYFEIKNDKNRPFIVHTPLSDISGKSASISIDANAQTVVVNVLKGSVSVRNNISLNAMKVTQDQSAVVSDEMAEVMVDQATDPASLYWKDQKIRFKNTLLEDVLRILNENIGINIELENPSLANCKLTADFQNEPHQKIVDLIVTQLGLAYEKKDAVFIISGKGC